MLNVYTRLWFLVASLSCLLHVLVVCVAIFFSTFFYSPLHIAFNPAHISVPVRVVCMPGASAARVPQVPNKSSVQNGPKQKAHNSTVPKTTIAFETTKKNTGASAVEKNSKKIEKPLPKKITSTVEQAVVKKDEIKPHAPEKSAGPVLTQAKPTVPAPQNTPDVMSVSAHQYDMIQLHTTIHESLQVLWHPPVGMPVHLACTVCISVNNDGSIRDVAIKKTSGVLAFDISARVAAKQLSLPTWLKGKQVAITFSQGDCA